MINVEKNGICLDVSTFFFIFVPIIRLLTKNKEYETTERNFLLFVAVIDSIGTDTVGICENQGTYGQW